MAAFTAPSAQASGLKAVRPGPRKTKIQSRSRAFLRGLPLACGNLPPVRLGPGWSETGDLFLPCRTLRLAFWPSRNRVYLKTTKAPDCFQSGANRHFVSGNDQVSFMRFLSLVAGPHNGRLASRGLVWSRQRASVGCPFQSWPTRFRVGATATASERAFISTADRRLPVSFIGRQKGSEQVSLPVASVKRPVGTSGGECTRLHGFVRRILEVPTGCKIGRAFPRGVHQGFAV